MTGYAIGSTFIADLSGGIALEISTARFPLYGQLIVRNAILRGGAGTAGVTCASPTATASAPRARPPTSTS